MIAPLLALAGLSIAFSWLGRRSVQALSEGRISLHLPVMIAVGLLASWPMILISRVEITASLSILACAALFLGLLAMTDQRAAWAPDVLTYPLAALSGALATSESSIVLGMALGAGLYFVSQFLFYRLSEVWQACPPPPDLMAFAIGPALLGFTAHYAMALTLSLAGLLVMRQRPDLIARMFHPAILEEARLDLGYTEEQGLPLPLLAVLFPAYLIALYIAAIHQG